MDVIWDPRTRRLQFKTASLDGTFVADGWHHGVSMLVHRPTGTPLTGGTVPLLALYRLLCRDGWLGEARETHHSVQEHDDGVTLTWAPNPLHQVLLSGRIRIREEDAIDLAVEVVGCAAYERYEVFISNYFHSDLRPGVYVPPEPGETIVHDDTVRIEPVLHPVYRGLYVTFPRDEAAAHLFTDGRWRRGRNFARFLAARFYARPLAYYRHPAAGVDAVLMGRREDLAAVSMAYAPAGGDIDDVAEHRSLYASLWGRDLRPGAVWRTALRLQVGRWYGDAAAHLRAWQDFDKLQPASGRPAEIPNAKTFFTMLGTSARDPR